MTNYFLSRTLTYKKDHITVQCGYTDDEAVAAVAAASQLYHEFVGLSLLLGLPVVALARNLSIYYSSRYLNSYIC